MKRWRPHCWFFGCNAASAPECLWCHAELYDYEYRQGGWLTPLRELALSLRRRVVHRCEVCNKRMWFVEPWQGVCSEKCRDGWIPF